MWPNAPVQPPGRLAALLLQGTRNGGAVGWCREESLPIVSTSSGHGKTIQDMASLFASMDAFRALLHWACAAWSEESGADYSG
jgi:hypothetical protein